MRNLILAMLSVCFLVTSTAFAGDCELAIAREACAGKEAESYKKCNGEKACTELKETASVDGCASEALKACENSRLDITKSKVITAKFDGAPVEGGKNFCDAGRADFNKCG